MLPKNQIVQVTKHQLWYKDISTQFPNEDQICVRIKWVKLGAYASTYIHSIGVRWLKKLAKKKY